MAADMQGKSVVVTGASAGLGKETAVELAKMGAKVVMTGRDPQRSEEALREARERTGRDDIEMIVGDFSSQAEVRRIAGEIDQRLGRLDVLVNNAALWEFSHKETADGYETVFAVNHLAPFLLTHLLLDKIKASAPSRVVTVSSNAHTRAKLRLEQVQANRGFAGFLSYANSKLANVYFSYELSRRLEGTGVDSNSLHPGVVRTLLWKRNLRWYWRPIVTPLTYLPFMLTPSQGAATQVHVASAPELGGVTGKYFVKKQAVESSPASSDEAAARRLWDMSAEMTGLAASV